MIRSIFGDTVGLAALEGDSIRRGDFGVLGTDRSSDRVISDGTDLLLVEPPPFGEYFDGEAEGPLLSERFDGVAVRPLLGARCDGVAERPILEERFDGVAGRPLLGVRFDGVAERPLLEEFLEAGDELAALGERLDGVLGLSPSDGGSYLEDFFLTSRTLTNFRPSSPFVS